MAGKMVKELIIPRCEGRAFEVIRGQILRVIAIEGIQVGDMTALNLRDFREKFSAFVTTSANDSSLTKATKLYSGPPNFNVMLSVAEDKVGVHWIHGRCTRLRYELLYGPKYHRNCHDNIAEALRPYGISEYDVLLDTFNIFMKGQVDENGRYSFAAAPMQRGDYIDFRAEMDVLVAISACPHESVINDYVPKALKIEIYEGG